MKNVMTLAAAGLIALSAPAFAGGYEEPIVEPIVEVAEGSSGSIGSVGWAILGLAVVAAIIVASDD